MKRKELIEQGYIKHSGHTVPGGMFTGERFSSDKFPGATPCNVSDLIGMGWIRKGSDMYEPPKSKPDLLWAVIASALVVGAALLFSPKGE